ncbi:MAG: hypothetical protein AAF607_09190 [Pseudomonadota bacterium]
MRTETLEGIPTEAQAIAIEESFRQDGATSTSRTQDADGTWTVTAIFE